MVGLGIQTLFPKGFEVVMLQGITGRLRDLINSLFGSPEPEIKYITQYVPYRGMDYYLFVALTILFGLCSVILFMKHRDYVNEINEHSERETVPKKRGRPKNGAKK